MLQEVVIIWFRRDLRLADNAALYHALKCGQWVLPIFIFDKHILSKLEDKADKRVVFIHQVITAMQKKLAVLGSSLHVYYGYPEDIFKQLLKEYTIKAVYLNHDYDAYSIERDATVAALLHENNISVYPYKDQVIFEKNEVLKDDGKPYTVFTPYSRKWKLKFNPFYDKAYPTEKYFSNFIRTKTKQIISLKEMGFEEMTADFPTSNINEAIIKEYKAKRDFPSLLGTSRLGVHLRFGTVSVREVARQTKSISETFLNELIWRDFYHMILWHFPHINEGKSFRKEYDFIEWQNNKEDFEKWCSGQTGYPIVDAGMRELNATGFMHNRVRMIVASFLTKHLLIDWRWGEAYFAKKLLDFDFAANNGGWQWAAGSGCDAAPYFRVFNPYLQTEKFDQSFAYIKKWVPEYGTSEYPAPIVAHEVARKRCLEVYAKTLKKE